MIDIKEKARQVYEQGFCVLESVLDAEERRQANAILDAYWKQQGSPPMEGFGFGIHPLMEKAPAIAPFYGQGLVVEVLAEVLQDDVHLVHTGARLSDEQSAAAIGWHNHYSWDPGGISRRDRIERVLAGVYVDGSGDGPGPLIVIPRKYNDPLEEPAGDGLAPWPGEIALEAPPGSAVIFDTALWHTARRGSDAGIRHLFGAHYQGWMNPMPHPEDNACNIPAIQQYKNESAVLRSLLDHD